MRRFINFYIVLFLTDASLSLTDELLSALGSPAPELSGLRNMVALLVIILSVLVYPLLGIDRRLPKRVLLPLTVYIFWCSLALWPLQGMIPRESFGVMAAWGQMVIGGVAVITLRSFYGGTLLPEDHFQGPLFGWRNTLVFSGVNLLLLPVLLIFSLMAIAGIYLDQATAGFMRLSPLGLYTAERSYQQDGKSVQLAAMMHVGRQQYYQELVDNLPAAKTIILAEGVTDRDKLLKKPFNYRKVAALAGLSSQETMHFNAHLIDQDDLDKAATPDRDGTRPDILRADVDIDRFKPGTIEFLNVLAATLLSNKPLAQGVADYNAWAKTHGSPKLFSELMADILTKRNQVVIDSFRRCLKRYDTIVIPWGAMHMPAIEAAVLEEGFTPEDAHERLVIDFRTLPYARLWKELSAPQKTKDKSSEAEGQAPAGGT